MISVYFGSISFTVCVIGLGKLQVGRAGNKKKARMARTRSDFLTRVPIRSVAGESEDEDTPVSPRHYTLPLSNHSVPDADLGECFSDSEMVIGPTPMAPFNPSLLFFICSLFFSAANPLQQIVLVLTAVLTDPIQSF